VLQRTASSDGIVFYQSNILSAAGVRHAFSTRIGGISPAPFDSLNLGNPSGFNIQDDYDRIWLNYAKLLAAIDSPTAPPLRVHQVHGNAVITIRSDVPFDTDAHADALVSRDTGRPISVRTADCLPVLLATPDGKNVAAIHAGWRGIVAGIIPAAIARLISLADSFTPADLLAATGPCIGPDHFEVGPEVATAFANLFGNRAPMRKIPDGKAMIDLPAAARLQLCDAGLQPERIDWTDRCTVTHQNEFFSHRRDNGLTGRMAAIILPAPA
jgi:YfiH family protein